MKKVGEGADAGEDAGNESPSPIKPIDANVEILKSRTSYEGGFNATMTGAAPGGESSTFRKSVV